MTVNTRIRTRRLWAWVLMAAGFIVALAASFFAPITWRDYWHAVILLYGWPLVAAILTSAFFLVLVLLAARRRQTSGFVALGMFISMVLHMLLISLFGFIVLRSPVSEQVRRTRELEVLSALPTVTENQVRQEVRASFKAAEMPEARKLDVAKTARRDPVEIKMSRILLEPKHNDQAEPAPDKMKAEPILAPKADIREKLTAPPEKLPDIDKSSVVKLAQLQNQNEAIKPVKPATREIEADSPRSALRETPVKPAKGAGDVALKDAQRAPVKGRIDVAAMQPARPKIEEVMSARATAMKADSLELPADTLPAAKGDGRAESKTAAEPSRSFELAHQSTATPEAPAPAMVSRELVAVPARARTVSFSDANPLRVETQPTVDTTALRGDSGNRRSRDGTIRMEDALAAVSGNEPAPAAASSGVTAQKNLAVAKSGQASPVAENASDSPKARIDLNVRPAAVKTFASGPAGATGSARADKPEMQERLLTTGRQPAGQPLVDVSGNAEALPAAGAKADMPSASPSRDVSANLEPRRTGTELENLPAGSELYRARPNADLSTSSSASGGSDERTAPEVPAAWSRPITPNMGDGSLMAAAGSRPAGLATVDVGGEAVAATSAAADTMGGTAGTQVTPREPGRALKVGKSRAGSDLGGGDNLAQQRPVRDAISSGSGAAHGSMAADIAGAAGKETPLPNTMIGEAPQNPAAGGINRAAIANAKIMPGMVQPLQDGSPASEAGGGKGIPAGAERVGFNIDRVGAGLPGSDIEGKSMRIAMDTAGRNVEYQGSLLGSDASALTPISGSQTPGLGQDPGLAAAPRMAAGKSDAVAFGVPAQAMAGTGQGARGREPAAAGPDFMSDVRVAKAGGQYMPGSEPGGTGLKYDSPDMVSSLSRPPARMDLGSVAGGSLQGSGASAIPEKTGEPEVPRALISPELTAVPKTVPEKAIYKLRTPERRKEFIKELGGSDKTELAVEQALAWLAKAQSDDGRWDIDGFKNLSRCGGPGDRTDDDVALTGLCLLSYLGAGYTHVKGEHKETVRKAVNWLVIGQKDDGDLQRKGQMYSQAIATVALCESYSMTGDERLRAPIEKAVDFILKAQNPGAGWRYQPRKDNDTSVTGWQVLALKSAMIAGIKFPPQHFQWVEAWLDVVRRGQEGGLYTYMPGHGGTPTMTAEGWFCQLLMREQTRLRGQSETIPYLMEHLPEWSPKNHTINLYFWYYATLALHMSGAAEFSRWNKALVQALLMGQVQSGPAVGSWDPVCVLGERGGRVYSTATAALCLEVYYRYLPFYKQ